MLADFVMQAPADAVELLHSFLSVRAALLRRVGRIEPVWHGPSVSTIDGISPRKARLLAGNLPFRLKDGIRGLVFDLRWLGPANWIVSIVRAKKA